MQLGVMCDFDASQMNHLGSGKPIYSSTIPFLAMEVLRDPGFQRGLVTPLYRHGCESFKWAFLYLVSVAEGSTVLDWLTANSLVCYKEKIYYLEEESAFKVTGHKHAILEPPSWGIYVLLVTAKAQRLGRRFQSGVREEYAEDGDSELYAKLSSALAPSPLNVES